MYFTEVDIELQRGHLIWSPPLNLIICRAHLQQMDMCPQLSRATTRFWSMQLMHWSSVHGEG